jgi:WD40 repeat protein
MRRLFLSITIALMALNIGLYAQGKDTAHQEPKVKLELVWEKEIPEGVKDFVFLDENGYNVFSVQCKNPEKALKEKRILMVQDGKLRYFEGDEMKIVKEVALRGGSITISKNGHNLATIEGLERDPSGKGGFVNKPAILRLYNWKGEELASTQILPEEWEYIDIYPLGNDNMVIVSMVGGEGLYYGIEIYVKRDKNLTKVFSNKNVSWLVDYDENGERALLVVENKEMVLFNGSGEEDIRYICPRPYRKGFLSPRGNYIVEITAGKYVMIFDYNGKLIAEHHVQGQGNYYAAFSPDEKYLLVSPGFRKIYLFETKSGNLVWEYAHPDDRPSFFPGAVTPDGEFSFVIYTPSKEENKWIWIFNKKGKVINELGPLNFSGYSVPVFYLLQTQELLVKLPSKFIVYHIVSTGGGR